MLSLSDMEVNWIRIDSRRNLDCALCTAETGVNCLALLCITGRVLQVS
jgi:hypothetical protein